jgi:hypothetical protein
MKTRLVLVVIAAGAFPSGSLAQNCQGNATWAQQGPPAFKATPLFSAKLERCKQEGTQMSLHAGISGGLKEFVQGCMQRGRR